MLLNIQRRKLRLAQEYVSVYVRQDMNTGSTKEGVEAFTQHPQST